MSKVKITSEPEGRVVPMRRQEINPYDGIASTLDGETMGKPRVQLLIVGATERATSRKSKRRKAA